MISRGFISEFIVAILVIALSVLLFNPFGWWMSNEAVMAANLALVVVFAIFAAFVWKERVRDERESLHRQFAGRMAYLAGVAILVTGVVVEGLQHRIDAWLLTALCVMVLAKIAGLVYSNIRH